MSTRQTASNHATTGVDPARTGRIGVSTSGTTFAEVAR